MANDRIVVRGAREHNLKSIDVEIPRDQLVVITGLSRLGQVLARLRHHLRRGPAPLRRVALGLRAPVPRADGEAGRRLDRGPVARHLHRAEDHLARTRARRSARSPRSTTTCACSSRASACRTARQCGSVISAQTVQQMVDRVMTLPAGSRIIVLAPVVRGRKGEYRKLFFDLRRQGYVRVRVNGQLRELTEEIELAKTKKHTIEVVVDRLVVKDTLGARLADSLETALRLADGRGRRSRWRTAPSFLFSERLACAACGISFPEVSPRMFSFNNPYGACPECGGIGTRYEIDPALVVPDPDARRSTTARSRPGRGRRRPRSSSRRCACSPSATSSTSRRRGASCRRRRATSSSTASRTTASRAW